MPCKKFVEFLREPYLQRIGLFPDPHGRDRIRAPARTVLLLSGFPDMLAPLAAQGIEKGVYHLA